MLKKALNPIWYLTGFTAMLYHLFAPLLRWLGVMKSEPPVPHEDRSVDDVVEAAREAAVNVAVREGLSQHSSAADVVRAYAKANVEDRQSMDLSPLSEQQQDWLLSRSDVDLVFLANETETGLERSLEALQVFPWKPRRPVPQPVPILTTTPMSEEEKALVIRARVAELWRSNGSPNPEPQYRH